MEASQSHLLPPPSAPSAKWNKLVFEKERETLLCMGSNCGVAVSFTIWAWVPVYHCDVNKIKVQSDNPLTQTILKNKLHWLHIVHLLLFVCLVNGWAEGKEINNSGMKQLGIFVNYASVFRPLQTHCLGFSHTWKKSDCNFTNADRFQYLYGMVCSVCFVVFTFMFYKFHVSVS